MTQTIPHLNSHHRKTLAAIFQHPASHNLEWHDVLSLLNDVGEVSQRASGGHEIVIGSDRLLLHPSHDHDLAGDDIRDLSAFLTKAGLSSAGMSQAPLADPMQSHCIVLIDHHHARLYGLGGVDGDPTAPLIVTPNDDDGARRRIEHKQGNDDHDGGHASEDPDFYERVAADLTAARRIVVLSDGKGRSSAGAYLVDYLNHRHPAIAGRIVATDRVNIAQLTDGEIVAAGTVLLAAG